LPADLLPPSQAVPENAMLQMPGQTWTLGHAGTGFAFDNELAAHAVAVAPFEIDDYVRWRLLEGLDDVGITLQSADLIASFERARPAFAPRTA